MINKINLNKTQINMIKNKINYRKINQNLNNFAFNFKINQKNCIKIELNYNYLQKYHFKSINSHLIKICNFSLKYMK